jgi:ubiquinone/menaquinone biosynthesis C-methylase UbiE
MVLKGLSMNNDQKDLWERLAKENSKYYINSDYGKGITEKEFNHSGWVDFERFILMDDLVKEEGICLEIGSGNGRMTQYIGELYDKTIGIDISSEMIRQAKEKLKGMKNVELIETDGYTIPLEDNSIDFAFSYIVFQHFKTMEMVESNFKEVYRVLKPGGLFKVRVRTDNVEEKMSRWWAGVNCDEQVALKQGFKLIKKEPVEHYALWLWLEKPIDDK